jgi:hypothetical protein
MKACLTAALAAGLLLGSVATRADEKAEGPLDRAAKVKVEQATLRADLRIARQALEEGHSGIYRYTPKEEMDRLFDRAEKSLDRPMSVLDFYRVLAPVVAAVKCGHTDVRPPADVWKAVTTNTPLLPLEVRVLKGKVYVLRDYSGGTASLAGKEVRSINGVPADKILRTMLAAAPGDGDVQTSRALRVGGQSFLVQLPTLIGIQSPFDVVFWDPKEKRESKARLNGIELPKITKAARAKLSQGRRARIAGELKFHKGEIAVMKIRGFGGFVDAERKKTLKEFYQESFTAMKEKGTRTLILDLRNNGGGADELGKMLLSYLLDKPFKYYDDLVVNALEFGFQKYTQRKEPLPADRLERLANGKYRHVKHPNWGTQQPSKPTFAGKVLILINGGSFSTTSEFLSHAHYRKRATFIGEESGGGYYGNTSGMMLLVTLPNTKVMMLVPLMTYYMAVKGYKAAAHGVVPDHPVEYSIGELLEGKDKEMELALKLAREPTKSE